MYPEKSKVVRVVVLLVFGIYASAYGQVSFKPRSHDAIYDPWSWRELDQLDRLSIRCLDQSPEGILWIGTDRGLVTYDGYDVNRYPLFDGDARVLDLAVVSENEIHFRTSHIWGRLVDGVTEVLLELESASSNARGFAVDRSAGVYLAGNDGLFYSRSGVTSKLETVFSELDSVALTENERVWIVESKSGRVAVYRSMLDGSLGSAPLYRTEAILEDASRPFRLFRDSRDQVWLTSSLPTVRPRFYSPDFAEHVQEDLRRLGGNNAIWGVAEGHDGTMWLAAQRALHRFSDGRWEVIGNSVQEVPSSQPMLLALNDGSLLITGRRDKVYQVDRNSSRFGGYDDMLFQCKSVDGARWFLTKNSLVGRQSRDGLEWEWFSSSEGIVDTPNRVSHSSDGTVWVSGSHRGAASVARYDGHDWVRESFPDMGFVFSHLSGYETRSGDVLFGVSSAEGIPGEWTGGLVRFEKRADGFVSKAERPPEMPYRVSTLSEEPSGALLVGGANLRRVTDAGIESLSVPSLEFPGWWVDHIAKGWEEDHWVSLWGLGVYRYRDGAWETFSQDDGLPSNQVAFALPSSRWGGVWVATSRGVSRYDFETWTDALPPSIVARREGTTLVEDVDGSIWVNIASRSWFFRSEIGTVVEGDFYTIRYSPERVAPKVRLRATPRESNFGGELYFDWEGNDFWSATPSEALEYSYRIDDGQWSPFERRSNAVVQVDEPGRHSFEVRVRDRDWNVSPLAASFTFKSVAPLWQRPWFILLTLGTIALIAVLLTLLIRNRFRHVLEVEQLKVQFFTYLSHELRTPLSVVLGPIESAMKRIEDGVALEKLGMAKRNAMRVLSLVDQLLDFRKFEYTQNGYRPKESDLRLFLRDCVESLRPLSEEKSQRLVFEANFEVGMYPFDGDMLQKIVYNLIGNAIKYSPESSLVEVTATLEGANASREYQNLVLCVADEGPGIDAASQRMVFEPFYRIKRDGSRAKGAGLGLALVKDLVDAWGGRIEIESPVLPALDSGAGALFRVELPLVARSGGENGDEENSNASLSEVEGGPSSKPVVLLVDDDSDFLLFLSSELSERFEIITANDGEQGMSLVKQRIPEVVVTDFHMPKMNGGELSATIKRDPETCHVPVILLTSDVSSETELASVRSNVDAFFQKPISLDLLVARLESVIETRQRLRALFSKQVQVNPKEIAVTSSDEALLTKAIDLVESRMQDEAFDVEVFSREMSMSSRTLARKLKAVTGMTPALFVRSIRLKRAAQLFEGGITSVSDVMVRVGIIDASYFSRAFKKEFGKTPSQYLAQSRGDE